MNLKDFLITGSTSAPDEDSQEPVARDNAGTKKKHQDEYLASHDARIKESEISGEARGDTDRERCAPRNSVIDDYSRRPEMAF